MSEEEKPKRKRKKVVIACVYCRRSHMICDDHRPCSRCIKRNIGHLCHDEPVSQRQKQKLDSKKQSDSLNEVIEPIATGINDSIQDVPQHLQPFTDPTQQPLTKSNSNLNRNNLMDPFLNFNQQPFFFSEHAGSEFSSLNEFLSVLDDPELINPSQPTEPQPHLNSSHSLTNLNFSAFTSPNLSYSNLQQFQNQPVQSNPIQKVQPTVSDSARDKFFLTAADPSTEISPEERLKQVINAKLEAGLLHPYNYAKGYARLQVYMDNYMNQQSKQRILKPLSIFRPAFRAIARTLKDVDLILVEENFERMLLDYDRVFTSMAIPACLWRRTGEIYRGNKEFASLVEVSADDLRDGKLAIYELMSEESAVNFWEKYGAIAFDKGQKAVLTSCNLRTRDGRKRKTCCFSFTIRRDRYNIPSCIVGNFIPINP